MNAREIRIIPFPGRPLEYDSSENARSRFPVPEQGFLIGPENYALESIVRWAVEGELPRNRLPILFYGASGCGKSHLLYGILEAWRKQHHNVSVKGRSFLLTGGDFARLYAESLETRTSDDFRRRYRGASLLLLDDLDRLCGKQAAQEELQHLLDALSRNGGTAVLTMSVSPAETKLFSESFRTRLLGGTTLPILLPGKEVRKRFLKNLNAALRLSLPDSALESAADRLPLSIPALYGMLVQMHFEAATSEKKVDVAYFQSFLRQRLEESRPGIDEIAKRTAKHFSLKLSDLRGKSRNKTMATARGIAVYLARRRTGSSVEEIARYFGNRDPSTIRYLIDRIEKEMSDDTTLRDHLFRLDDKERS